MEWTIFLLGIVAIGAALFWERKERRDFARIQEEAMRPGRPGDLEAMSLVVQDLQSELAHTAEKVISDLESKSADLRGLIDEAKRVESRLRLRTGEASADVPTPAPPSSVLTVVPVEVPTEAHGQSEIAPEEETAAPVLPPTQDRWREREGAVWEMANRGCTVGEIAKQLNIGKGEVRLILDLKKAQAK